MGLLSFVPLVYFFGVSVSQLLFEIFPQRDYCPYGNGTALMIRLSPYKNTNFTDAEAQMTLGMSIMEKWCKAINFIS
jgi:inward rectifier potassium channel